MERENPHMPESYYKQLESLPENDPAREKGRLTTMQSFALPILLWFFDNRRNRAAGRTHLMAITCIELAIKGNTVPLSDPSTFMLGSNHLMDSHFIKLVIELLKKHYSEHKWKINSLDKTLTIEESK